MRSCALSGTLMMRVRMLACSRTSWPPAAFVVASLAALLADALNFTRMGTVGPSWGAVSVAAWAAVSCVAAADGSVGGVVGGVLGAADATAGLVNSGPANPSNMLRMTSILSDLFS